MCELFFSFVVFGSPLSIEVCVPIFFTLSPSAGMAPETTSGLHETLPPAFFQWTRPCAPGQLRIEEVMFFDLLRDSRYLIHL